MDVIATKRQLFADVPVNEVRKTLHISEPSNPRLKNKVLWVRVGSGNTTYTMDYRTDFDSGTVLTLTSTVSRKQQRWMIE